MHVAVIAHLLVALVLPAVVRKSTRAAFAIAAIPPAGVLIWVLAQSREVLSGQLISETVAWAPLLGLEINFLLDPLALAMTVLVAGIGTLVLIYSIYYFRSGGGDARRRRGSRGHAHRRRRRCQLICNCDVRTPIEATDNIRTTIPVIAKTRIPFSSAIASGDMT